MNIEYRKNEAIKSVKLMVIDENGELMGEMQTADALFIAQNKELDLVEVSPNAKPPVAKILAWNKFKYQLEKKKKESKTKRLDQKEMWFKAFIGPGDLEHKLKRVTEFLAKKHGVKLTIRAKGPSPRDSMIELMNRIMTTLKDVADFEGTYKFEGRNLSVIARPTKSTIKPNIIKTEDEKDKN